MVCVIALTPPQAKSMFRAIFRVDVIASGARQMSSFCAKCGTSMDTSDQFCRTCGTAVVAPHAQSAAPAQPVGPATTSTKAIISLIFGILFFLFPLPIVAVIFGHLALSEIRKSGGRLTGQGMATAGLILGYTGAASIPIILIVAAIAIPNLLRARMAANESSAVASVRIITTAQITHQVAHPEAGYACALSDISDTEIGDTILLTGQKNGYRFEIRNCAPDNEDGPNTKYRVVAYPLAGNESGVRAFCTDESAVIKQDAGGSPKKCMEDGAVLQ